LGTIIEARMKIQERMKAEKATKRKKHSSKTTMPDTHAGAGGV